MSFYKRFIEPHREEFIAEGQEKMLQTIMTSLQASDELTPNEKARFTNFIGAV